MKYMLLIYEDDVERVANMDERMPNCAAYAEAMKKAGIYLSGERLRAASTTRPACASSTARRRWSTVPTPRPRSSSADST